MSQMTVASAEPQVRSLLRMVAGFTFSLHGFPKLFGVLGGMGGKGAPAEFFSLMWAAGFLEAAGGMLILLGLFTRPVAFVLAGEMAYAYFRVHAPRGFWPLLNGGELAALYCFLFLWMAAAGAGPWSLDRAIGKR